MKPLLTLFIIILSFHSSAQLNESFTDGNFTVNPSWSGTTSTFTINASSELQTSNTVAATSYLTTPHAFSPLDNMEWRIRVKITTAPSASNYARIFLTSTVSDLSVPADGYFLQLGEAGSTDAIRLKKLAGGVETEICSGPAGQISAAFNINIRVVRDATGLWSLYADATGGTAFNILATGTDNTNFTGTFFGVSATYTLSNASKYRFDDIYAGPEIVDSQAPSLLSVTVINASNISLQFDEPVSGNLLTNTANYTLSPQIPLSSVVQDATDPSLIHLFLATPLDNGREYSVTTSVIEDLSGNIASSLTDTFTFLASEIPVKGDLIISEFLCNTGPSIGLPEAEFVEIYNKSAKYFDLSGWKIGDASTDGTITSGWIAPGEYKVLCATSSQQYFSGSYSVTSFPSLNNSGDNIVLKDPSLTIIDKLSYTDSWYRDDLKAEGGYSVELINPNDPCSDASNWKASNHADGGTPGQQNSVCDITPDTQLPLLKSVFAIADNLVQLNFSEGMDSTTLVSAGFITDPSLNVNMITASSASTDSVQVLFAAPLHASQLYTFTYGPVADCWLNMTTISGSFALADMPVKGDLVINEILYDPSAGGSDFVELYNRSGKVINLRNFAFANYSEGLLNDRKNIDVNYLVFPGDYVVISANSGFIVDQFFQTPEEKFIILPLPSYNNDSSSVILLLPDSTVCDLVSYTEAWHLPVIDETENKTLERIDPYGISNTSSNWHTAAESAGFGTPGRINSQYQAGGSNGDFGTMEPIFSPDNDGFQDVIMFYYSMPAGEMIATVNVYDDHGRLIRNIKKSELLAPSGNFTWDGMNNSELKSQLGVYLAVIEAFSLDGKANFSKRIAFTLAGKLD